MIQSLICFPEGQKGAKDVQAEQGTTVLIKLNAVNWNILKETVFKLCMGAPYGQILIDRVWQNHQSHKI